jgi:uncharacterized protein (TIGR00297 family)
VTAFSEDRRQILHVAVGLLALTLRWLSWGQALVMAAAAIAFNLTLLPRLAGRRIYRTSDLSRGVMSGIVLYPIAVLLLLLAFPGRPDIVASAWAILAFGDGCATLVGRRGRRRLPWNRDKSVAGTIAFVAAGASAGIALAAWTRPAVTPTPPWTFIVVAPLVAAIVAALVETIPVRLDDNLSVPASAAAVLWAASLVGRDAGQLAAAAVDNRWLPAVIANAVFAAAGWAAGTVSAAGAIAGAGIGLAIFLGAGFSGWVFLLATFLVAAASSRLGWKRKSLLGIAEERGGRRGPGNALANCGLAAAASLVGMTLANRELAWLVLVTALTAGGSDTVASEVGKAWGRRTFMVIGFGRVKPGTSGAVSLEGTLAGLAAAAGLAALGVALDLIEPRLLWIAAAGATAGSFVESALGATLEGPGILNNDLLNFLNTAVAAATAVALLSILSS